MAAGTAGPAGAGRRGAGGPGGPGGGAGRICSGCYEQRIGPQDFPAALLTPEFLKLARDPVGAGLPAKASVNTPHKQSPPPESQGRQFTSPVDIPRTRLRMCRTLSGAKISADPGQSTDSAYTVFLYSIWCALFTPASVALSLNFFTFKEIRNLHWLVRG
jgi:hypothetical protein